MQHIYNSDHHVHHLATQCLTLQSPFCQKSASRSYPISYQVYSNVQRIAAALKMDHLGSFGMLLYARCTRRERPKSWVKGVHDVGPGQAGDIPHEVKDSDALAAAYHLIWRGRRTGIRRILSASHSSLLWRRAHLAES